MIKVCSISWHFQILHVHLLQNEEALEKLLCNLRSVSGGYLRLEHYTRKKILDCEPYLLLFTVNDVKPTWLLIIRLPSWKSYAHNFTTFNLVCMHLCPVITSVQEWYKEPFLSLYFSLQCSRSACHLPPHEDIVNDAYMQELNAVMLHIVIFVTLSNFVSLSPSYSSTCQVYCKTSTCWEGLGMTMLFFVGIDGQILHSVFWLAWLNFSWTS